jgi:hypothetical protein
MSISGYFRGFGIYINFAWESKRYEGKQVGDVANLAIRS